MSIEDYEVVANDNNDPAPLGFPEGESVLQFSEVNDGMRLRMEELVKWYRDIDENPIVGEVVNGLTDFSGLALSDMRLTSERATFPTPEGYNLLFTPDTFPQPSGPSWIAVDDVQATTRRALKYPNGSPVRPGDLLSGNLYDIVRTGDHWQVLTPGGTQDRSLPNRAITVESPATPPTLATPVGANFTPLLGTDISGVIILRGVVSWSVGSGPKITFQIDDSLLQRWGIGEKVEFVIINPQVEIYLDVDPSMSVANGSLTSIINGQQAEQNGWYLNQSSTTAQTNILQLYRTSAFELLAIRGQ